jgi:ketopantoate hydroxymethyltransferase
MAKVFGNAGEVIFKGLAQYVSEVTSRTFPQRENYFTMPEEEYKKLLTMI